MEEKYLLEICNPKQWKTIPKSQLLENGKFPVYGANGIIGRYNEYNHEKPTVLITCRGATCGNIHITVPNAYINGNAMALDNLNEIICKKEYLYYFLQYYDMSKIISGTAQPQITITGLKKVKVKLYSINKQEKIVNELNKINKLIKLKKRQLEELQKFIKSQFVEMFGDIKNSKFDINSIKKLVDINIMKTKKKHKKRDIIKYVDISSIDNLKNEIISYKEYEVGLEPSRAQQCLEKGDILISTVRPNLKNIAVNNYEEDNIVVSSGFCVLRVNKCMKEYLFEVVKTEKFTNDMILLATGANYPAIRDKDILDYKIAVPPITLQNQFSEIVKQIDKQKFESMIQLDKEERKVLRNIITDTFGEIIILYEFLLKKYFEEGK